MKLKLVRFPHASANVFAVPEHRIRWTKPGDIVEVSDEVGHTLLARFSGILELTGRVGGASTAGVRKAVVEEKMVAAPENKAVGAGVSSPVQVETKGLDI